MGGKEFAQDRDSDEAEKMEGPQLWKHSGGQKNRGGSHMFLIAVRVVDGDGRACIMPNNVPLLNLLYDADFLDLFSK